MHHEEFWYNRKQNGFICLQIALADFIHEYHYESVHMKFRGNKAMAYVYFNSFEEADMMVRDLDSEMFYGRRVDVQHSVQGNFYGIENCKLLI